MPVNVIVAAGAGRDIWKSYQFYERQEPGLGSYFRQCISSDLKQLPSTAGIHRKIMSYYHVKSKIFQSIICYRMEADTAIVVAILDGRIDPAQRDKLLKSRV